MAESAPNRPAALQRAGGADAAEVLVGGESRRYDMLLPPMRTPAALVRLSGGRFCRPQASQEGDRHVHAAPRRCSGFPA